ncbi:ABC transporter permease [Streptomyces sp. NPDC059943]|uniref:ABC transporter permease n=1 Tax=Streptomyces sp. NPDC059943 TaxID=3347010 RepID=UPI003648B870
MSFTGTGNLLRLALRRDRIQLPVWIVALTLVTSSTVSGVISLYANEQERVSAQQGAAENAVALVFNGLVSGTSEGATAMTQALLLVLVAAALMSSLTVVRHTRQNEETGRAELIGSSAVGRHAALTAALILAVLANVVLALVTAVTLIGSGLSAGGSLAAGAAIGAVGIAFAGVAAVTAQIWESSRAANGAAAAFLGLAFLLRAVGDAAGTLSENSTRVSSSWPSWLSPIGWGQQIRPFDDNAWWVLILPVAAFAGLVGAAFALTKVRDVGMGLRAVKLGPPSAAPSLLSPFGLAWRLQRGALLGWAVGVVIMGFAFGAVGDEINDLVGDSDRTAEIVEQLGGAGSLVDSYLSATVGLLGLAIGAYAVQLLNRMRSEETTGGLESLLSTSVSRYRWLTSQIACAVIGIVALTLLSGLSAGLGYGIASGDIGGGLVDLTAAALARLPAVLVLAGVTVAAFGMLPRLSVVLPWGVFAICLLIGQVGAALELPQAVLDLSPYSHVPQMPSAEFAAGPVLVLLLIAAVLMAGGAALFRRRNLSI